VSEYDRFSEKLRQRFPVYYENEQRAARSETIAKIVVFVILAMWLAYGVVFYAG
jgi:hypothetical protein